MSHFITGSLEHRDFHFSATDVINKIGNVTVNTFHDKIFCPALGGWMLIPSLEIPRTKRTSIDFLQME